MQHFVNRGKTIQLNWTLHSISGQEFSLTGHAYRLLFCTGNQSALATGVTHSGNVLSWTFLPDSQWKLGSYTLWLEVFDNGQKIVTLVYPDAFHLIHEAECGSTTQSATQTNDTTLNIVSSCDFYRFAPVCPVVGDDGYWYVNGVKIKDGNNEYVLATHTVEYDSTTRNIIIDAGRVDSHGDSIAQVITALADLDSYYQATEGSSSGSVVGDGSRWGSYKAAEAARDSASENAEGTSSSTAGDGTRWGAYKTAEAARDNASGSAIERANAAAAAAEHMVDIRQGPPGVSAIIGQNGNWWTWDDATEQYVDTGDPSRGQDGQNGQDGQDGQDGVGFASVTTPSTADGTILITLSNGDTITLDLNHQHTQYPKYVYCASQAAYEVITTKESDTLYLILESN